MEKNLSVIIFYFLFLPCFAQHVTLSGSVYHFPDKTSVPYASVFSESEKKGTSADSAGHFSLHLSPGKHTITVSAFGYRTSTHILELHAGHDKRHDFHLVSDTVTLEEVNIDVNRGKDWGVQRLNDTEGTAVYAGKKNEVINMDKINANTSTNNMRQIYSKVPGINVIENDAAGIQLSIATRGLNPNRTTEFNTRQNGYDISADPIGYPESYYSPPAEAVERIEVVRGAASLQYGTQFGGLLNFKMRRGSKDKPFGLTTRQTVGSYGFFNSFNSIGGTCKKLTYYSFYNYKRGDGWRSNAGFNINTGYFSFSYRISNRLTIGGELTLMRYTMQQPGGLTDAQFEANPRASYRNRNWFAANWNMPAVILDYYISEQTKLNVKLYGLFAGRNNVGILDKITVPDTSGYRTVMRDVYSNKYVEARLMHHYAFLKQESSLLLGVRYYRGNTQRRQGLGSKESGAGFSFNNPQDMLLDFWFPSYNAAFFAENVFRVLPKLSLTPGMRYEIIESNSVGSYDNVHTSRETRKRSFPLLGLGLGYKVSGNTDFYANISQNYSPVNFSDITVSMPNFVVDPGLKDVRGYNGDVGYRGILGRLFNFDVSVYYMAYNNRIDNVQKVDAKGDTYTYRTNVADSRSIGTELFGELNIARLFTKSDSAAGLNLFSSVSYTDARYISNLLLYNDKKVAFAPGWIIKTGLSFTKNSFSATLQYSRVGEQFSDATNAVRSRDGSLGIIPAYYVMDLSANYSYKKWLLGFSVNNLTNNHYFTRRTSTAFPGPGIIPSDGISLFVTAGFRL